MSLVSLSMVMYVREGVGCNGKDRKEEEAGSMGYGLDRV